MYGIVLALIACFLLFPFNVLAQEIDLWEDAMLEFEQLDSINYYPPESILFTGSSSIRLWETLEEDMAPYPVIQRGFGGSRMPDVLKYADRYIKKHRYSAVVVFVANDITGNAGEVDKHPSVVLKLFEEFVFKIRSFDTDAKIFIMAITPTNSRWHVWENIKKANMLLAQMADEHKNVIFVPTEDLFLDEYGRPKPELFVSDQLHLSPEGYKLWAKRLRSYLDPILQ